MGFAVRELEVGCRNTQCVFRDAIRHSTDQLKQTWMMVSSTDPWHREADKDPNVEQPGFDLIANAGFFRDGPILMPVGALYDTPDNVAAEVAWLKARKFPLKGFEIGEEPDGQCVDAAHYAFLYAQMAEAIRRVDSHVSLGGPSLQSVELDFSDYPKDDPPWFTTVLKTLEAKGVGQEFQFATFEWYPFDNVFGNPRRQLREAVPKLAEAVRRLNGQGMSAMPWMITEYGWSAYAGQPEVEIPGAIFNLDVALNTIRLGGQSAYLYGYEPNDVIQEKPGAWGNNMILLNQRDTLRPLPTFYGAQLLTREACMPSGMHGFLDVTGAPPSIGVYAIKRPDGRIALLLTNRSSKSAAVHLKGLRQGGLRGWRYDASCYQWRAAGAAGHPILDRPPYAIAVSGEQTTLPPLSITLLLQGQ
jgi:hypothetical protein